MNYENFCKVLSKIEADPSCWDQESFYCNCFAGIAADMSGCKSQDSTDRRLAADAFLGIGGLALHHGMYSSDKTLDYFRGVRHVEGTRRLMALAQS